MRKKIAFIFILLANITVLAHAVVPHHHHNNQLCIESNHCENCTSEHQHEHDENKHHQQTHTHQCRVGEFVLVTQTPLLKVNPIKVWEENNSPEYYCMFIQFASSRGMLHAFQRIFYEDFQPIYFSPQSSSAVLRAPPVV